MKALKAQAENRFQDQIVLLKLNKLMLMKTEKKRPKIIPLLKMKDQEQEPVKKL